MKPTEPMILPESPEAAEQVTVTLWKSRDGQLHRDERLARWSGATHVHCERCQAPTEKGWILCGACRGISDTERWNARERKPWDGKQMVYSDALDKYFESPDDALEAASLDGDDSATLESLRLVLCDPEYASIDADNFCDITPDDAELPGEVLDAIDAFNNAVAGKVCCWTPGRYALQEVNQ